MNIKALKASLRENPKTAPYYHALRKALGVPFYKLKDTVQIQMRDVRHYLRRYYPLFLHSAKILRQYRGTYVGKRCFIIGNGPSLSVTDLEKIKDEFSIGSNYIYQIYDKTVWRPTVYTTHHMEGLIDPVISKISDAHPMMVILGFCAVDKVKSFPLLAPVYIRRSLDFQSKFPDREIMPFSEDITNYVYDGNTITYTNIQIAVYLGFKEIILLGVDHQYVRELHKDGTIHFNKNLRSYFCTQEDNAIQFVDATTFAYETARRYADQHGIRILNATRGGRLEVFERVNFDDLF